MTYVGAMQVMLGGKEFSSLQTRIGSNPLDRKTHFELDRVGPEYVEQKGQTLTLNAELTESVSAKVIAAHREYDSNPTGTDLDDGAFTFHTGGVGINNFPPYTMGFPLFHAENSEKWQEQDSFEIQIIGELEKLKYVLGAYTFEEEVWETNPQYFSLPGPFLAGSSPATCAAPPFSTLGLCNFGATAPLGAPLFVYGGEAPKLHNPNVEKGGAAQVAGEEPARKGPGREKYCGLVSQTSSSNVYAPRTYFNFSSSPIIWISKLSCSCHFSEFSA
jgi:hypothetical protein